MQNIANSHREWIALPLFLIACALGILLLYLPD